MENIISKIHESLEHDKEWQMEWSSFALKGQMCRVNNDFYLSFFMPKYHHLMNDNQFMMHVLQCNARDFVGKPYYFAMAGQNDGDIVFQLRLNAQDTTHYYPMVEEFLQKTHEFCYEIQYETPLAANSNPNQYNESDILAQKDILCQKLHQILPNFDDIFIYSPLNHIASIPLSGETPMLIQFNDQGENIPFSVICGYCDVYSDAMLAKFLTANFHGSATNGGVLGMGDDGIIILNQNINFNYDDQIAQNLCALLDYGESWNNNIANI